MITLPTLNVIGLRDGSEAEFGAGYNVLPIWKDRMDTQPVREVDRYIMGMLRKLGIEKGKPFNPTQRQKKILLDAMHEGGTGSNDKPAPRVNEKDVADLNAAVDLIAMLKYEDVAAKLTPLAATFAKAGSASHAAKANFWLGYCREKLGNTDDARKLYDHVARKYPDTPAARQAIARATRMK